MQNSFRKSKGFTLLEVIISLAIFMVAMVMISYIFVNGFKFYTKSRITNQFQETARGSLNIITTDLREAYQVTTGGALGEPLYFGGPGSSAITFGKDDPWKGAETIIFNLNPNTRQIERTDKDSTVVIARNIGKLSFKYTDYIGSSTSGFEGTALEIEISAVDPAGRVNPVELATKVSFNVRRGETIQPVTLYDKSLEDCFLKIYQGEERLWKK